MNVEEKLCEFWEARRSLQPNTRTFRPFHGWQRGAGKHLVFLFRVKAPEILKIIAEVQADLCGDEAFVPFPSEYLHITVKVWGFLEDKKDAADDILPKEPERAIPHLRENVATVKAFETELGRVNVFPSVVFAEVKDGGGFAELNRKVLEIPGVEARWSDHPNYIPHLAIGTFREGTDVEPLMKMLETRRKSAFGKITVGNIELVIAHWRDSKFPIFEPLCQVELQP